MVSGADFDNILGSRIASLRVSNLPRTSSDLVHSRAQVCAPAHTLNTRSDSCAYLQCMYRAGSQERRTGNLTFIGWGGSC